MASGTATGYDYPTGDVAVTAPSGGYAAGDVVVVRAGANGMIGIATGAAGSGGTCYLDTDGEYTLPKETGTAHVFAVGDVVYFDVADDNCQAVASANIPIGIATAAAAAGATTVQVRLIPSKS